MAPWADVHYACDYTWWKHYGNESIKATKSEHWSCSNKAAKEFDLRFVRGDTRARGLLNASDAIATGQNSGYQAIGLAYLWGASRILLLGYDFGFNGAKRHWHADHPNSMGNCGGNFGTWAKSMGHLAADLKAIGVEVVNCSRSTTLRCFPRSTIDKELEGIK